MKRKQTTQRGFSSLRVLWTLLVWAVASWILGATGLGFFGTEVSRKASQATLTFAERVAYQRPIEDVYWWHRFWPKENLDSKPSLDAVMSQAQLENKVSDYRDPDFYGNPDSDGDSNSYTYFDTETFTDAEIRANASASPPPAPRP
jgi:hypothetical protein